MLPILRTNDLLVRAAYLRQLEASKAPRKPEEAKSLKRARPEELKKFYDILERCEKGGVQECHNLAEAMDKITDLASGRLGGSGSGGPCGPAGAPAAEPGTLNTSSYTTAERIDENIGKLSQRKKELQDVKIVGEFKEKAKPYVEYAATLPNGPRKKYFTELAAFDPKKPESIEARITRTFESYVKSLSIVDKIFIKPSQYTYYFTSPSLGPSDTEFATLVKDKAYRGNEKEVVLVKRRAQQRIVEDFLKANGPLYEEMLLTAETYNPSMPLDKYALVVTVKEEAVQNLFDQLSTAGASESEKSEWQTLLLPPTETAAGKQFLRSKIQELVSASLKEKGTSFLDSRTIAMFQSNRPPSAIQSKVDLWRVLESEILGEKAPIHYPLFDTDPRIQRQTAYETFLKDAARTKIQKFFVGLGTGKQSPETIEKILEIAKPYVDSIKLGTEEGRIAQAREVITGIFGSESPESSKIQAFIASLRKLSDAEIVQKNFNLFANESQEQTKENAILSNEGGAFLTAIKNLNTEVENLIKGPSTAWGISKKTANPGFCKSVAAAEASVEAKKPGYAELTSRAATEGYVIKGAGAGQVILKKDVLEGMDNVARLPNATQVIRLKTSTHGKLVELYLEVLAAEKKKITAMKDGQLNVPQPILAALAEWKEACAAFGPAAAGPQTGAGRHLRKTRKAGRLRK